MPIPPEPTDELFKVMRSVSLAVPEVSSFNTQFLTNSTFGEFSYQVQQLPYGYVAVQYLYARATFTPSWANPMWNVLEYDTTSEINSIRERLREAFRAVPEANWNFAQFDVESLRTLLRIDASWLMSARFTVEGWVAPYWR